MKYKAIIFDFDDTLVESRLQKWAQHRHVAKSFYNIDLIDEDIQMHWGKPIDELIATLYRNSDHLEGMQEALMSTEKDFYKKVYNGAPEIIHSLIEQGVNVGVLSASNKAYIEKDLLRLNFPLDNFFAIQGADETDFHKPNPKVFEPFLQKLFEAGIDKTEILYVGDSLDDFHAATGAEIDFIGVATGLYTIEDFQNKGAKQIISDIRELNKLLNMI